jgi:Glyoxalase-like domain
MNVIRLRQVVVAAADREAVLGAWQREFGVGEAFADPGVGEFGLHNWVVPVGDAFLEVVAPMRDDTTAGRYMARRGGDCGYMVIFQVDDIEAARNHLRAEHCRTVWNADLPVISATHLHPADVGGAIVSVDEPRPAASWLWGGPNWESNVRTDVVSAIAGVVIADPDVDALAERWARLLGLVVTDRCATLPDGSSLAFVDSANVGGRTGLVGINLRATNRAMVGGVVSIANVDCSLV